ncbi:MAG TPA: transglycosylase domain-containing protein, partial [Ktedonobacteraceae bacterium]|nr:transglycosylase domain-containing protein [Ktedonobacteraceae bacterium]
MKHRRARWQQNRPRTQAIASGILIALLLLLLIGASSGGAYAYKYYQDQLPQLQSLANQQISQTTRIYDRNGVLLFDAYASSGRRTPVSYDYLPQVLKDAQTSAEDPTFWTNSGIDPQGILRAGGQYLQAGGVVSGGSTMTQQLIKNMTGDAAPTLNRKIPEAALAIGLTQQYPKTKIMEMYFNVSPYGALNEGVEAAVEDYFHLNPQCDNNFKCIPGVYYLSCSDASHLQKCDPTQCDTAHNCDPMLGLARASLLAGMPQDPPTYDPTLGIVDQATGVKYYLERQQYVLNQMLKYNINIAGLGPITQDMANQAEALTAKSKFPPYQHIYYHGAQHFVQWVIQQLES